MFLFLIYVCLAGGDAWIDSYGFSNSFPTDPMAVIGREHQVQSALNFIDNHFSSCRTTMCCIVIWYVLISHEKQHYLLLLLWI